MKVRLRGGARIALSTHTQLVVGSDDSPEVKIGQVELEVPKQAPGQQFRVVAGPYAVVVVGTRFKVIVGSQNVGVEVQEGVVEVQREGRSVRLEAGQNWTGWIETPPQAKAALRAPSSEHRVHPSDNVLVKNDVHKAVSPALEPAATAIVEPIDGTAMPDLAAQAKEALHKGNTDQALTLLAKMASHSGVAAENALYEMGRILRDYKRQPHKALDVWTRYRTEHPSGLLSVEVDLSVVETYANIGDINQALIEADSFLTKYPRSERRVEVLRLQQLLMARKQQGSL
jgi:hypothetical protein